MKILEILEAYETERRMHPQLDRGAAYMKVKAAQTIPSDKFLGRGLYSTVSTDDDDHLINKRSHSMYEYDNFHEFAEWVINNDRVRNNPHFPRIYEVDETPVDKGTYEYGRPKKHRVVDYKIEKLYPSNQLNPEQCMACLESTFGRSDNVNTHKACTTLFMMLRDSIYNPEHVVSDSWKEALVLLNQFMDIMGVDVFEDLHSNNIMFRLGAHAPIPVINDPVA